MRSIRRIAAALLVGVALALSGCGGGGDAAYPPAFDVAVIVAGHAVPGVYVLPGDRQTVYASIGQSFELNASGPVAWTVVVAGSTFPDRDATITYGGATIHETLTNQTIFAANTWSLAPLPAPVAVTVYATSLVDPAQTAVIDLILTN